MQLLKSIKISLFIVLIMSKVDFVFGQAENLNLFDRWIEWTDGRNMLVHHLNKQAFAYLDVRDKEIAGLKTQEDWIKRQKKLKDILMKTTSEHGYLGSQTLISGVSLARYFTWDGIRGIDYLVTRSEVDPARLGVTGQSGGGTQAADIFAFDERVKAGAPVNYITGFRRLLESIGPQDAEQNFYHGILNGLTHADLLEVRAPNPALISAGTYDFFSIQGARETYAEVRNAYKAFGKEENIGIVEDDFGHGLR